MAFVLYAVPFFFLLIGLELLADRWRGMRTYRLADALNSLSAGVLSQASGLLSNDSDANNDALTITSFTVGGTTTTLSSNTGTYTIANAGTITIRSDGSYDFTPAAGFTGPVPPITYSVSDGTGRVAPPDA